MTVPTLGGVDWSGPERDALVAGLLEALDELDVTARCGVADESEEGP